MPEYKSQKECHQKAEEYIKALRDAGYDANLKGNSFRDYSVKVLIKKGDVVFGDVIVYHKPSTNSFTLGTHELKIKSVVGEIESIWYGKQNITSDPPVISQSFQREIPKAYVDGSYSDDRVGYGIVILVGDRVIQELSGTVDDPEQKSMHQIGGEMQGVITTLEWARQNSISEVEIYYDYVGLEKWAVGEWKTKNIFTTNYKAYVQSSPVKITWTKVKGHSNDRWNERADQLAGEAANSSSYGKDQSLEPNLVAEVEKVALEFTSVLNQNEIDAKYDRIYNGMFARIKIEWLIRTINIDIYNTARKHLEIHWPAELNKKATNKMVDLWQSYKMGKVTEDNKSGDGEQGLELVDYYYKSLKPYRALNFDFIELSLAIRTLYKDNPNFSIDVEFLRFNFDELEKLYWQITGENHG